MARLLPYSEAKEVINKANQHFRSEERSIWVHASTLEEANGNVDKCDIIISRGIAKTSKRKQVFEREEWLDEAQQCEKAGSLGTCRAIIKAVYGMDVKEQEKGMMWIEDADLAIQRGNKESAKIMFECALILNPSDRKLWDNYLTFLQKIDDKQEYLKALGKAAEQGEKFADQFLLRLTKEMIKAGKTEEAQKKMKDALEKNPKSEIVILAFVEQLKFTGEYEPARKQLKAAQESLNTVEIWRFSIKFERDLGNIKEALETAKKASEKHPYDIEIGCDLSIVYEEMNKFDNSRDNYMSLVKNPKCQRSSKPWIQFMRLEEKLSGPQKVVLCKRRLGRFTRHRRSSFKATQRCGIR